ncbi:MAG: fatty acid desaturase, partial [Chitinophagaceae bacterium]
ISIVFQLAHTVEHTQFPMPDVISGNMESEWAVHQIQTTANFANNSKWVSWFTGGLNFQIEHHLFPKISHIHYPAISRIIKEACQEYHLQYIEFPRLTGAIRSHVVFLRQMGRS